MSILQILHYPDVRLRKIAEFVSSVDRDVLVVVEDMFDTMYAHDGVGLSATQVDVHKNIVVVDVSEERNQGLAFVNVRLLQTIGTVRIQEGCLSIPHRTRTIRRAKTIRIKASNCRGEEFTIQADNLLSVCLQHEIDHLSGRLLIDHPNLSTDPNSVGTRIPQ